MVIDMKRLFLVAQIFCFIALFSQNSFISDILDTEIESTGEDVTEGITAEVEPEVVLPDSANIVSEAVIPETEPEILEPEPVIVETEPVVPEPELVAAEPETTELEPVVVEPEPEITEVETVVVEPEIAEEEPIVVEPVPEITMAEPVEAEAVVEVATDVKDITTYEQLEDFIVDYYSDLNSKKIREASSKLSTRFIISYGGYGKYETFWLSVDSVYIRDVEVISQSDQLAILKGSVVYSVEDSEIIKEFKNITLVKSDDSWKIR